MTKMQYKLECWSRYKLFSSLKMKMQNKLERWSHYETFFFIIDKV
jgi:hypothetical protein